MLFFLPPTASCKGDGAMIAILYEVVKLVEVVFVKRYQKFLLISILQQFPIAQKLHHIQLRYGLHVHAKKIEKAI